MTRILVLLFLLAAAAKGQYIDITDPHSIARCTPTGKGESAQCACLGMVGRVQDAQTRAFWKEKGMMVPPTTAEEELKRLFESLVSSALTPDLTKQLNEAVWDHCQIISKYPGYHQSRGWLEKAQPGDRCSTVCKPERCFCADSPCKSHEESTEY